MATQRALLLIADIGGYTQYMQFHRSLLGHAEAATRRMLDKIVDAARGFDLIEIEGDAAFLSRDADGLDGPATLSAITRAAVDMHRAFHAERRFVELNLCPCQSCTQTSDLKLKFVAHVGEVATQTIKRRKKLVGLDVIYVHRLLKNAVGVPEYLLVSDDLFRNGGTASSALVDARDRAGPRGHRTSADVLRERRGLGRAAPAPSGSFVAPAYRRDPRHGRPGPSARPPPPTRTVAHSGRLSCRRCCPDVRMCPTESVAR